MKSNVAHLRKEYGLEDLKEETIREDPMNQFQTWFEAAREAEGPDEVNVMTLATATPSGQPGARLVLLKDYDEEGFVFYTNYQSEKARQLDANPKASLVFWWRSLERQVRVEGTVVRLPSEMSDIYFRSRPRTSQLGAWASPQSEVVESRAELEERMAEVEEQYEGVEVPRPPHWGGYRLRPSAVEFWQGRPGRLHDRLRYRRQEEGEAWTRERLAP